MPVFASVKIEKLLSQPTTVLPNQFYLVEDEDGTRFYLSDTSAVLHLLNGDGCECEELDGGDSGGDPEESS